MSTQTAVRLLDRRYMRSTVSAPGTVPRSQRTWSRSTPPRSQTSSMLRIHRRTQLQVSGFEALWDAPTVDVVLPHGAAHHRFLLPADDRRRRRQGCSQCTGGRARSIRLAHRTARLVLPSSDGVRCEQWWRAVRAVVAFGAVGRVRRVEPPALTTFLTYPRADHRTGVDRSSEDLH